MIESFTLADFRKMLAMRPYGWPRFTVGDLHLANGEKRLANSWFRERQRRRFYTASDTLSYQAGTAMTWSDTTGTFAITLNNLAHSPTGRCGAKSTTLVLTPPNGGTNAVPPDYLSVNFLIQFNAQPTAGGEVQLYFSFSNSGTAGTANAGFAAASGGADAAFSGTDQLPQMQFVGSLIASNTLSSSANQRTYLGPVIPLDNFFSPVVWNATDQNLKASNDVSVISVTPYWRQRAA